MAYLINDIVVAGGNAQRQPVTSPRLSVLERETVQVSLVDDVWSTDAGGRFAGVTRWIFGAEPAHRLANDRLEALRRYAILYRLRGSGVAREERQRVIDAGFAAAQLDEAHALIARFKLPTPGLRQRIIRWTAGAAAASLFAFGLYQWLVENLGDGTISMVVLLLIAGTLLPLAPKALPAR